MTAVLPEVEDRAEVARVCEHRIQITTISIFGSVQPTSKVSECDRPARWSVLSSCGCPEGYAEALCTEHKDFVVRRDDIRCLDCHGVRTVVAVLPLS